MGVQGHAYGRGVAQATANDDPLIWDIWVNGTYFVLYMQVVNKDAASYVLKTPEESLLTAETEKT